MRLDSPRVERYFQRTAVEFDALYDEGNTWEYRVNRLLRRGLFERVRLTVAQFQDMSGFELLDVGCGSGRNSVLFAQAGARRVLGLDFADSMIQIARSTAESAGLASRCEFIKADFMEYAFQRKFGVVLALGVFDYVAEPVKLLRRMMDVSTGKVIGSFPAWSLVRAPLRKIRYSLRDCPLYLYTRGQLGQICRSAGLQEFTILPYASSGYLVVGRVDAPAATAGSECVG